MQWKGQIIRKTFQSSAVKGVELAQIEPTTRCNYTCGYCCGRQMPQQDMPFEAFTGLIEAFPDLRHIELQGEGEPLLHKRFFDMAAIARDRGIDVSFITNGSYFSARHVERILDLGIRKIAVSIDSADPAMFKEIRGGKLEKVVRGLRLLMARRRERGLDRPAVGFSMTLMRKTLDAFPAIAALYRDLRLDGGLGVQPLQRMDAYVSVYDAEMSRQLLDAEEIARFEADNRALLETLAAGPRREIGGFYDQLFGGWNARSGTCPWLERGVYLSFDGFATPCCNIKDTRPYSILRIAAADGQALDELRTALAGELRRGVLPAPCRNCKIADRVLDSQRKIDRLKPWKWRLPAIAQGTGR